MPVKAHGTCNANEIPNIMKIFLFALTVAMISVAGCATQQDRITDPNSFNKKDYNSYDNHPAGHDNNGLGYDARGDQIINAVPPQRYYVKKSIILLGRPMPKVNLAGLTNCFG